MVSSKHSTQNKLAIEFTNLKHIDLIASFDYSLSITTMAKLSMPKSVFSEHSDSSCYSTGFAV